MRKRLLLHQLPSCAFATQVQRLLDQHQATDAVPPLLPASDELAACTCAHISEDDVTATRALLPVVCFYLHHRVMKDERLKVYKQHQADVGSHDGSAVITLDYKENIKLNVGPEEEGRRFYNQAHHTVLGFLCQYKDRTTGRMVNHYVDYISSCLTHDAAFALDCLRLLIADFLLPRGLHTLKVWSDCGPHFRCNETVAGVCVELPWACRTLNVPLSADLQFFGEKHGKSAVDGHFSLLSRWLRQAAAQHNIVSTADLERALPQQAASHLQAKRSPDLPDHRCDFVFYTPPCQEHSGSYHESLLPAPSSGSMPTSSPSSSECGIELGAAVVEPSLPSDGDELEACMAVRDNDGDVEMTQSQWASQPSSLSFPSTASSPSFSLPLSPPDSLDVGAADDAAVVAAADLPAGEAARVGVCSDVSVPPMTGARAAESSVSAETTSIAEHTHNQQSREQSVEVPAAMHTRVEGRVRCTRPRTRRPSIKISSSEAKRKSVSLNTHYSWSCCNLPDVTPPSSPSPSSPSSSSSLSSPAIPMEQVTAQDLAAAIASLPSTCPVTLCAAVLPDSAVWPELRVKAEFRSKLPVDKKYIAFAPRLQAMPDIVVHPQVQSAMRKRLQSVHHVFSHMNAKQARSVAAALA
jgi:hypothetical protein